MNRKGQTVCLNMIVKNEAPVIRRCLDSVLPFIDHWLIVDTGSTDGTQEIVRRHLAHLPGELVERPWVNFAHNRSEALALARGRADYVFVIDADETVEADPGWELPELVADSYDVEMRYGAYTYLRKQLVRDALPWRYSGVLHEYIHCEEAGSDALLPGIRTVPRHDGARARDPLTYRRDALLLESALLDDPGNTRYVFYLAQSYRDAGDYEQAARHYRRRVEMGGWAEEVWFSLYQLAQIAEGTEKPWPEALAAYLAAYQHSPDRAEPLFRIGVHHQAAGEHAVAHLFFSRGMRLPVPAGNRLFVDRNVYDYLLPVEYAVSAFYVGDHAEAIDADNALLRGGRMPPEAAGQVVRNRRFSLDALHPSRPGAAVGRLRVLLPVRDPGAELDEALDLLLRQEDADFEAVVVDAGPREVPAARIPPDPRLRRARAGAEESVDAAVDAFIRDECGGDDVVLLLPPGQRLADRGALGRLRAAFGDAGCRLLYAPRVLADGRPSAAEPAPDEARFLERGPAWAAGSALALRPSLWREAAGEGRPDAAALWRAAGFAGTRFADEALTADCEPPARAAVRAAPSPPPEMASFGELPRISCLMITRDRLALACRSMRCYADQTYPERELVVVCEGEEWYRRALERYVEEHAVPDVRFVWAEPGMLLGALRNLSIDAAAGPVLCQWDDDDCCHPDRLAAQYAHMAAEGARACFLTDHLQYLEQERLLFWIDWTMDGRVTDESQLFPGTVMLWADPRFRYPESGPFAQRGEDSVLVGQLFASVPVARLAGMGHLYLYRYHGRNTFGQDHHYNISACGAPAGVALAREDVIRQAVRYFGIPRPVPLVGRDGPAFTIG